MANIREIAKLAGVSVSTVSRVLNHHPYVSQEKRDAVMKTMEHLDYRRNMNAVHLSKGKTNKVGVVMPTINHPYFSGLLDGIAEEAMKHKIQLVLFQTDYKLEKELEALEQLRGHLIDGVIFCSRSVRLEKIKDYKNVAPVVLCEDADQQEFPSISIEHVKAFNVGLDYLVSKGHRRIAICLGRLEGTNSRKRKMVYENKLAELGEVFRSEWVLGKCLNISDGKKVFHNYSDWDEKPTAFLVGNDQVAAGLIAEAAKKNKKVPEDLAVLSFDNHPISEIMGISTIDIPTRQMGISAFNAFLKKTVNSAYNEKIVIPFKIIERESV